MRSKAIYSIILLIIGSVIFFAIEIYMVINAYKVEKVKFENEKNYYISTAFYRSSINTGIMTELVDDIINDKSFKLNNHKFINENRKQIDNKLDSATLSYRNIENHLKQIFFDDHPNLKYRLSIIIHTFLINDLNKDIVIYDALRNGQYYSIYGDTEHVNIKNPTTTFFFQGKNYNIKINAYLKIYNLFEYLILSIKGQIIGALISLIIFILITIYASKTIKKQIVLDEMKTDFINNMTHELKTPLSTLVVASKTLKIQNGKQSKIIDTIQNQVRRLEETINKILNLSVLREGQFYLNLTEVNVIDVIDKLVDECKLGANNIEVICDHQIPAFNIYVDQFYFKTAISNILENSIKYSNNPKIEIKTQKKGMWFIVNIADNGPGIDKQYQKYLFDKFYRVPSGNLHEVKGAGLGLHYVKLIMKRHKGKVELISDKGKGTELVLMLPCNDKS